MEADRATLVALARWAVISEAVDERLSPTERGRIVAELASTAHRDADGQPVRVTARTIYRWIAAWRRTGFEGLKPYRRKDAGVPRTDPQILQLAAALRREAPARSAAHICEILSRTRGWQVSPRTLQRFFAANGLDRARLEGRHRAYGRFETTACGDLWFADAWHGPAVDELNGRAAQLFSTLDDHSRFVPHAAFYPDLSERRFQHCLKTAISRRGLPRRLYMDLGGAFTSTQLKTICGRLAITITHSAPYRPQGRGKHERHFRTIAEQFAVEVDTTGVATLAELNRYFAVWVEQVYHRRVHRGTGQAPMERWMTSPSALRAAPDPDTLRQAFLWSASRQVTKTRTVPLEGNTYQVDPWLVGRRVELRYDPSDLTVITVFYNDQPYGQATPLEITNQVDRKLRETNRAQAGPPTGISYLETLAADHAAQLRGGISYLPDDNHDDKEPT